MDINIQDKSPISDQGVPRLNPKSVKLLRLDDEDVIIEVDIVGRGPIWVRHAHFLSLGKETSRIEAPRRVKLKVRRTLSRFSTRRRFFMGRETFTLNSVFTLHPPPQVSLPINYTQARPHPLHLDPLHSQLRVSAHSLEILGRYRSIPLAPPRVSLNHSRCHLSPNFINLQPQFQRKPPPHD